MSCDSMYCSRVDVLIRIFYNRAITFSSVACTNLVAATRGQRVCGQLRSRLTWKALFPMQTGTSSSPMASKADNVYIIKLYLPASGGVIIFPRMSSFRDVVFEALPV